MSTTQKDGNNSVFSRIVPFISGCLQQYAAVAVDFRGLLAKHDKVHMLTIVHTFAVAAQAKNY